MRLKRATLFLSLGALNCNSGAVPTEPAASAAAETPTVSSQSALVTGGAGIVLTSRSMANAKKAGLASPNNLSPELYAAPVAQGSNAVENPQSITLADGTTATAAFYGYDGDGPLLPAPGDLPSATHKVEASKTEPDKNTYLVLYGQTGPDAAYDYGSHFLFQGHELGTPDASARPGQCRRPDPGEGPQVR